MSRLGIDDEPYEYSIEPAETWGWWITVGHGILSYPPTLRFTLKAAHRHGRRKVAAAEARRANVAAKWRLI